MCDQDAHAITKKMKFELFQCPAHHQTLFQQGDSTLIQLFHTNKKQFLKKQQQHQNKLFFKSFFFSHRIIFFCSESQMDFFSRLPPNKNDLFPLGSMVPGSSGSSSSSTTSNQKKY